MADDDDVIVLESDSDEVRNYNDDDEEEDDDYGSDVHEMEEIIDVRVRNGTLQFKIKWVDSQVETWEPEENFIGSDGKNVLNCFKLQNKEKIDDLIRQDEERKRKKDEEKRQKWFIEEIDENEGEEGEDGFAPRELTENDSFYGKPVKELQGESRKLFDPSHKQTTTDLLLATYATTEGRISRSKAAELKKAASEAGSGGESSRSQTPSSLKMAKEVAPVKRRGRPKRNVKENDVDETDGSVKKEEVIKPIRKRGRQKKQETNDADEDAPAKRPTGATRGRKKKVTSRENIDDNESDDEPNSSIEVKTEESPPQRTIRGRKKKAAIVDSDDDEEEEDEKTVSVPNTRKRGAAAAAEEIKNSREASFEPDRRSETPETSKPKYFEGRNDDEGDEMQLWVPVIAPSTSDPVAEVEKLMKNMVCSQNNLIEAVRIGDLVSARLIANRMSLQEIHDTTRQYRDPEGRPLLHTIINKFSGAGMGSVLLSLLRFVLSIDRQFHLGSVDKNGNFPIHEATRIRNFGAVRLFALSASPLSVRNRNRKMPIDIAIENRDTRIFEFLMSRGVTYTHLFMRLKSPSKDIVLKTPPLLKILQDSNAALGSALVAARRRIMKGSFKEIMTVSQIMTFSRHDSNDASLQFEYKAPKIINKNQGHFLIMHPIAYHNSKKKWMVSLTNSKLHKAPIMNGHALKYAQGKAVPSVFHAVPLPGLNHLEIALENDNWESEWAIAIQIVRYEIRTEHRHDRSTGNGTSLPPPPLPQQKAFKSGGGPPGAHRKY